MKYILTLLIVIILVAGCSGVDNTDPIASPTDSTSTPSPNQTETGEPLTDMEFDTYYSRLYGAPDLSTPDVLLFQTAEELKIYADEVLNSENYTDNLFDENVSAPFLFSDITTTYNDAYFEDDVLLIVRINEYSCSIRHNVAAVETNKDTTTVYVDRLLPSGYDTAEAYWHIIIEASTNDITDKLELKVNDYNTAIDDLSITSGNVSYLELYKRHYSANTYIPEVGETISEYPEQFDPDEVLENLIAVEWNENFQINVYCNYCSIGYFRVYDENLENPSAQTDTLDISQFDKPGTYIIRFVATWTLGTKHGADQPDTISEEYFFSLVVDEEDLQ